MFSRQTDHADSSSADSGCYATAESEKTEELGERLGRRLVEGDVVTLSGPLGSGKTTFVKGIARGLDVVDEVTSPTYSLISEYRGRLVLYHVDLYRVSSVIQYESLAMDEVLYGPWVTVIEWPEHAQPPISVAIRITFSIVPAGGRTIQIEKRL